MKTQMRVWFIMLLTGIFLTSCGAFKKEDKEATPSIDEQAAVVNPELEELAKELAELNCDYSKLIVKVLDGDMDAEQKAFQINDRILALSEKVEALIDTENPAAVTEWAELYGKYWAETDCE